MIEQMLQNEIVVSCAVAALFTGLMKIIISWKKKGRFDITQLWETGGIPSSHSALVSALLISVFFVEGFSTILLITLVFTLIVIRDSFGIRQETGHQAVILNKIIADLKLEKRLRVKRLKELVGHTSTQVQIGILIGVAIAVLTHFIL